MDFDSKQILIKSIESNAAESNFPTDWIEFSKAQRRRNSSIIKLFSPSTSQKIIIKTLHNPKTKNEAELNFLALKHYHSKSDKYSVPKPIGVIDNSLIMEFVEGKNCKQLFQKAFFNQRLQKKLISATASWLSWFHKVGAAENSELVYLERLTGIEKRISKIKNFNKKYPDFIKILEQAKLTASIMESVQLPFTNIHGDFKPSNLIFAKDKVYGLDFSSSKKGAITYDICRFLSHIDIHRPFFQKSYATDFDNTENNFTHFINSYGDTAKSVSRDAIRLIYLTTILDRWSALLMHRANFKLTPAMIYLTIRLKRIAKDISK